VRRAEVGSLFVEAQDARPLGCAVDLGERLVEAAEVLKDRCTPPSGGEGMGMRRAEVRTVL
jgi:hypothetical protein